MAHREVTAIQRDTGDIDRRIDLLQGPDWGPLHIDDVVLDLRNGTHTYYVTDLLWEIPLEAIYLSTSGRWYVRTVPNGERDDNLYALPEIVVRRLGA
jgi:Protein of unknown function (DUF3892)